MNDRRQDVWCTYQPMFEGKGYSNMCKIWLKIVCHAKIIAREGFKILNWATYSKFCTFDL
jgi:hypothetical protein